MANDTLRAQTRILNIEVVTPDAARERVAKWLADGFRAFFNIGWTGEFVDDDGALVQIPRTAVEKWVGNDANPFLNISTLAPVYVLLEGVVILKVEQVV